MDYQRDDAGIVTLVLDLPGARMNVWNQTLAADFEQAVTRFLDDDEARAAIVTSAKDSFMAGADLDEIFNAADAAAAEQASSAFKALLRRLETGGRPVAAAINGTALGGGLELALACHYRVALDAPGTRLGLPEVKLGLLPGGGGTQRLPRLIGIQAALPLLLEGRDVGAAQALKAGIVDELASSRDELLEKARAWVLSDRAHTEQPWDRRGFQWPGGDAKDPRQSDTWTVAPNMLRPKTHGNYPAPVNILSCVYEGGLVDFDTGCDIESRYFANCAVSPQARNMITALWYQLNDVKKGRSRPAVGDVPPVRRLGVLGPGMMGSGIAYVSAKVGIDVVLKGPDQAIADAGKAFSARLTDKALEKGRTTADQKDALLSRIRATDQAADLEGCDLVIEAVFENPELKARVAREALGVIPPEATFASNTSTLPITMLARASDRPDQFVGIHFFSPVERMQLVEIIKGEKTSDETLARAFDYVRQIGKVPIVVNDSRGFYTSRVFATYIMEGAALLAEGNHPHAIEVAGVRAGMPVGPLALMDEVSLSLVAEILEQLRQSDDGPEHPGSPVISTMVDKLGRQGRAAGAGFYEYPKDGRKQLWPGLAEHFPCARRELPMQDMIDRLLMIQANEAARCLGENVVTTVADANVGSILGWGFAPFKGGVLQYINDVGVQAFVDRCRHFARDCGLRFQPAPLLLELAESGKQFH